MLVTAAGGLPVAADVYSARPAEVTLTEPVLAPLKADPGSPVPLLADKAFDGDPRRVRLLELGFDLVCPHRANRSRPPVQDGRKLRRHRRRGRIERTFAWLKANRRLQVRHERLAGMFRGFLQLACVLICLRHF
jgi:transposase